MFKSKIGIGLYIANNSVNIAQMKPTPQGPRLISFAQVRVVLKPEGAEQEATPDKCREAIAQAIREALDKSAVKAKEVVTALSGGKAVVRHFFIPERPKEEQEQAVKSAAPRYIPFKIDEVISDFRVLGEKGRHKRMEILFVAAKKERLNEHTAIFNKTGLRPEIVDTLSFALIRAFLTSGQISKDKATAIVYLEEEGAININIVKNRIPYLTRDISLAGKEGSDIREGLLNEIRLSFDYYKRQFSGEKIEKVIICGQEGLDGYREYLEKALEIPVEKGDLSKGIQAKEEIPPQLVVAIGLALRQIIAAPPIDINLSRFTLPPTERRMFKLVYLEAGIAVILLLTLHLVMAKGVREAKDELLEVKQGQPKIEKDLDKLGPQELKALRESEKEKLSILQTLIRDRVYWTPKFNALTKLMPPGVWLTEIRIEDRIEKAGRAKKGALLSMSRSLALRGSAFSGNREEEMALVNTLLDRLQGDKVFLQGIKHTGLETIQRSNIKELEVTDFEISGSSKQ